MAEENEDGQEKTEEPSQRKIEKAKEDGKVLSSKEMFVFTNISMGLVLMFAFFIVARQYLFEWADLFVFDSDTKLDNLYSCLLYTSPSPRDATLSRMPSSA